MPEDSITITVSGKENIDWIRSKVRDGQFASEDEAVACVLDQMREDDQELELWLKNTVASRLDEYHADPTIGIPIEQVEQSLAERLEQREEVSH